MKKAFRKNIFRTIRKSLGRYLAILSIIALGVGFFSGLKASKPSMMKTGEEYLKQTNMFDYHLISTWGFSEAEIEQIARLDGVAVAEGAVWEDFIYTNEEGTETCIKALSITESVNGLTLQAGRMPQTANECVLDGFYYPESMIGQEITISTNNTQETKDSFCYDTYTVTGLIRTPLYMHMERGTTTIGSGKLDGFMFIPLDGFSYEYLEEVYVSTDADMTAFSDEYETYMEKHSEAVETSVTTIVRERYLKEVADAQAEIADAEQELSDSLTEAGQELEDAKKQLEEGEQALLDGQRDLEEAEALLRQKEQELLQGETAYQQGWQQYQAGLTTYQTSLGQYEGGKAQLEAGRAQYEQALASKSQMESLIPVEELLQDTTYQTLSQVVTAFEENERLLNETKAQLDGVKVQLDTSALQLQQAKDAIDSGKIQIEQGKNEIANGWQEIKESKAEIEDGWKEYEDGKQELEQESEKAQQEIADAKEELADVEEPEVFVLDRGTNMGYASYENDVSIVEGIAKVFPLFFFLIAALVCSTTMTRMVDDERTQIGTLRAVGYSEGAILSKYLIYSGSAAGIGATLGYLLGTRLFPWTIWTAYNMMYGFAEIIIVDNVWLFLISLIVSFLCSAGTTFAACHLELTHAPAELIRPKAPSAGKRILLERISFLWKRMKFLHKVSARNIFRFKKRMFMMILGIAGCTALVVAGFGVRDSVVNIVNNQYDQILRYDISATYTKEVTDSVMEEIHQQFSEDIEYHTVLLETAVDAVYDDGVKSVTLLASDDESISRSVDFHLDGKPVSLPGKGEILIDERMAEIFSAGIGDTITLKSGEIESKPLTVVGIFENYTFYYAYMTSETYQDCFGTDFAPKTIYLALDEDANHYKIGSYLADMKNSANVSVVADVRTMMSNMLQSMNYIVALVICCAAALAFIVLFNLGNINISERVREIATLKVLGFYPGETGAYVFRESAVLSIMGMIVGMPLGVLLHRFIMLQIKIDMVSFEMQIHPMSFLYSAVAVLSFTIIVDLIMRKKINRINMAESLKSIE